MRGSTIAVTVVISVVIYSFVAILALSMLPGRFEYVKPTPVAPMRDMELWVDGVEYFCHMYMSEWKCDETGRTKGDAKKAE